MTTPLRPRAAVTRSAPARAWGKKLGRQPGQRPKSDRPARKFATAVAEGRSYRRIASDLAISTNTVLEIMQRHRKVPCDTIPPRPAFDPLQGVPATPHLCRRLAAPRNPAGAGRCRRSSLRMIGGREP